MIRLPHHYKKLIMVTSLVIFVLLHDLNYSSNTMQSMQKTSSVTSFISNYASSKKNDAYNQSNGFFISTTNKDWERYRNRFHSQPRHVDNDVRNRRDHISATRTEDDGDNTDENNTDENINTDAEEDIFYQDNYDAEFTCLNEVQLGLAHVEIPDERLQTPIWICDPQRILTVSQERSRGKHKGIFKGMNLSKNKQKNEDGCLVYAFGNTSTNPQKFFHDLRSELKKGGESGLMEVDDASHPTTRRKMNPGNESDVNADTSTDSSTLSTPVIHSCEIHAFSPSWDALQQVGVTKESIDQLGVITHSWGIESKSNAHLGRRDHLTFQETLEQLGHHDDATRTTIDILSIDCDDGCEWHVYNDILESGIFISQILIVLRGAPYQVNDFFLEMKRHGYVIFHKDSHHAATSGEDSNGSEGSKFHQTHSYSLIRLADGFFQT